MGDAIRGSRLWQLIGPVPSEGFGVLDADVVVWQGDLNYRLMDEGDAPPPPSPSFARRASVVAGAVVGGAAAVATGADAVDRSSELAAVAEARKAREVPTEGDAWGERVARPAPRRLSGGDGSRAAMVARLHGPSAGPPVGLLDAIKAAKQKPSKPVAAAPVVDLFAELRRTATRVE